MQTINFFRASMFNSSYSAFKLVLTDSKNIDFARRIITAKNESAHCRLIRLHSNNSDYMHTVQQIKKYNHYLNAVDYIAGVSPLSYRADYHRTNIR